MRSVFILPTSGGVPFSPLALTTKSNLDCSCPRIKGLRTCGEPPPFPPRLHLRNPSGSAFTVPSLLLWNARLKTNMSRVCIDDGTATTWIQPTK